MIINAFFEWQVNQFFLLKLKVQNKEFQLFRQLYLFVEFQRIVCFDKSEFGKQHLPTVFCKKLISKHIQVCFRIV